MCVCVCVCVCVCACVHAHVHVCVHVCVRGVHTHVQVKFWGILYICNTSMVCVVISSHCGSMLNE